MDISVIILSYNTRDLLRDCLRSVKANTTGLDSEIFVVDSSSTDGSIELVREQFPEVKLIVTPDFRGFAYANNLVLRQANGRYQLLLNSDMVLSRRSIEKAMAFMEATPEAGMMGPKLVKEDGTLDLACRRNFPTPQVAFYRLTGLSKLFPKSHRFARYNLTYLDPDETTEVDSICAAFMLVRHEAVEQVGLLDETFYFYGEDLDWAMRFKENGWKVYYVGEIQVLHFKGQTSKQQSERMIGEFYKAMKVFYEKHYASGDPRLIRFIIGTAISVGERWARFKNRLRPPEARRVGT